MTSSSRFWWKTFAIALGVALLLVLSALLMGGGFLSRTIDDFEAADAVLEEVPADLPVLDASDWFDPARVEAFLSVQEAAAVERAELEKPLRLLSGEDPGSRLSRARAALGLPKRVAAHLQARNEALVEAGLSLTEYYHLYAVAYYAWLDKSPADGPPFEMVGDSGFLFETLEPIEESAVRTERDERTRRSLNRRLLPLLQRQLADVGTASKDEAGAQTWRQSLETEIAALEADPSRLPWQDGVPPGIAASFEPYRERLESSYSEWCSPVEVAAAHRT